MKEVNIKVCTVLTLFQDQRGDPVLRNQREMKNHFGAC